MPKPCPRCSHSLTALPFGSVVLDGCNECGGIWFDHGELNKLTRDPSVGLMAVESVFRQALSADAPSGQMLCPVCSTALKPFSFPHTPGVELDACHTCKGIWLDDGELQQIAARRASDGQAQSTSPTEARREQVRAVAGFLISAPCLSCGTTNPAGTQVCWSCKSTITARSVVSMCPRCDAALGHVPAAAASAEIDGCRNCGGIWCEQGELPLFLRIATEEVAAIVDWLGGDQAPGSARPAARCPKCRHTMERRPFAGREDVLLDLCPICQSVWLDRGEMAAAHSALGATGGLGGSVQRADHWG